jgi:uncharacterized membrane-anchored protein YhcB (DUF1043 family)
MSFSHMHVVLGLVVGLAAGALIAKFTGFTMFSPRGV